ncbi:MAG: hypothetical protein WAL97_08120 [Halobacteriota archaeon]
MQFKPIAAITVLSLVAASLLVSGCTSPTTSPTTSNNSTTSPALTMTATYKQDDHDAYTGTTFNVTAVVYNDHAGTLKLSTDNFILSDSAGYTHTALGTRPAVVLSENGESDFLWMHFQVSAGTTPSNLTYYDGTNKVECTIS